MPLTRTCSAALVLVCLASLVGCGRSDAPTGRAPAANVPAAAAPVEARPARAARPRIVFLGDSLTAGLGLQQSQSYPSLIQQRLNEKGYEYDVVNAGVSGDTSAGALRRLDWALEGEARVLVVALGGNDALRGLSTVELQKNLATIIEQGQARGLSVILAGMEAPPNFGRPYQVDFHRVYPTLARQYGVPLVPFLLEGVAGDAALNQADGIHPTAEGARKLADNVWRVLEPVLGAPHTS